MARLMDKVIDFCFFGPWSLLFKVLDTIVPNHPSTVLFGSNHGSHYSDNSRALFEYFVERGEGCPIWVTRSNKVFREIDSRFPGHVVRSFSLRGLIAYLRASQIVVSHSYLDMCLFPYSRSKKVNYLWHGVPIRRIGNMIERGESRATDRILQHWSRWNRRVDCFFASSDYEAEIMQTAFGIEGMRVEVLGYPRNDSIQGKGKEIANEEAEKVILYAPTYRLTEDGDREEEIPLLHPSMGEDELHDFLSSRNARVIFRPHPSLGEINFSSDRIECITVEKEPNLSSLFLKSDILVTDYSSAYFDWLILDRPAIFSVFDLEEYRNEMGFIQELEVISAGRITKSKQELLENLDLYLESPNEDSELRAEIRKKFGIVKKNSCEDIAGVILGD